MITFPQQRQPQQRQPVLPRRQPHSMVRYICGRETTAKAYTIYCPVHRKGIEPDKYDPVDKRHLI